MGIKDSAVFPHHPASTAVDEINAPKPFLGFAKLGLPGRTAIGAANDRAVFAYRPKFTAVGQHINRQEFGKAGQNSRALGLH